MLNQATKKDASGGSHRVCMPANPNGGDADAGDFEITPLRREQAPE